MGKRFQEYRRLLKGDLLKRQKTKKYIGISLIVWILWVIHIHYAYKEMNWPLAIGMGVVIVPVCLWSLKNDW